MCVMRVRGGYEGVRGGKTTMPIAGRNSQCVAGSITSGLGLMRHMPRSEAPPLCRFFNS
jgi:hypothetical protein